MTASMQAAQAAGATVTPASTAQFGLGSGNGDASKSTTDPRRVAQYYAG